MIQRIQSVCLLVVGVLYFLYWVFSPISPTFFNNHGAVTTSFRLTQDFFHISQIVALLISLICFISILLFKKRLIQIKLSKIALFLSIFVLLYITVLTFCFLSEYSGQISFFPSGKLIVLKLSVLFFILFLSTYLIFFAIKSIKKDEKLVKGEGLIR